MQALLKASLVTLVHKQRSLDHVINLSCSYFPDPSRNMTMHNTLTFEKFSKQNCANFMTLMNSQELDFRSKYVEVM